MLEVYEGTGIAAHPHKPAMLKATRTPPPSSAVAPFAATSVHIAYHECCDQNIIEGL